MKDTIRIVEQAFRMQAAGSVIWPQPRILRMQTDSPKSKYHVKACCLLDVPVVGIRTVGYRIHPSGAGSSTPESTRFVLLIDPITGSPKALIDEHWNYSLRTAASAAVAVKYLACRNAGILGLIGAGTLAGSTLTALNLLFNFQEVRVNSRRDESRTAFAQRYEEELGLNVRPVSSPREAVEGAHIVIIVTTAGKPLVELDWFPPGALICQLGSGEVPGSVYVGVDKVVVDSWEQNQDLPDIKMMIADGCFPPGAPYADLEEIISAKKLGRENAHERILVRLEGLVSHDIAVANWVCERAIEDGRGTVISTYDQVMREGSV